ncbi:hypothetical protein V8G54_024824 [Vigna mungo]|uniref:Uncharacterized protein n=1 Tax=Vigna mungo TaxID=3915 RepID=A0AAQ3N873_VIGMU
MTTPMLRLWGGNGVDNVEAMTLTSLAEVDIGDGADIGDSAHEDADLVLMRCTQVVSRSKMLEPLPTISSDIEPVPLLSEVVVGRYWCDEGRISDAKALFARSPFTLRLLTSEFVIANHHMLNQFGAYCDIAGRELKMVSCKSQYFVLALSFWGWITCIHVTSEKNSLKPGEKLNSTTLVLSENGYGLGFQTLDNCCYLIISGIGPKYEYWPAWVGNRNQPVDKDASLLLSHSGELKIESKDIEPIILYSSPQPSENTVATLLDTGNFVLQQLHPNGTNTTLWQSFDYPTDNLFPGMKLGVNHKSGHKWSVVSWLTSEKPSVGAFELEWEPTEKELTIKRRGKLCWTSGNLGNGGFMHDTYYMIVSNENESYFSITTFNEEHTRWALLETGQLINRNGADNNVARADLCYGYNTDEGCQQWEDIPLCRHPGDVFDRREGYPNEDMVTNLANSSYGLTDCRDMCWRDCTCAGFKNYNDDDGTGCVFYHWNFTKGTNFATGGSTFYLLVNSNHHKGKKMWIWIIVVSVVAALLVICAIALVIKKRKRLLQEKKRKGVTENNMADLAAPNRFFYAWELWKEGAPLQLVDPSLSESFDVDEVKRCIQVGLLCVAHYANDRPTMSDVVSMLTNESSIVTLPQRPAFYLERGCSDKKISSEELNSNSMDEITASF